VPLFNGGANPTAAVPLPATTTTPVGGPGGTRGGAGTNEFDAVDGVLVPFAFVAVTVQLYVFPFVKPVTTSGLVAPETVPSAPPFDDVHFAVNVVIGRPPSLAGGENATDAEALPAVATTVVGGSGAVAMTHTVTSAV
jgi:hypothetical protein